MAGHTDVNSGEQVLSEQERLLDLAPVLVRDLDDRIIRWTQGMEHLYGWPREEAVGRISHDLLRTRFPEPLADIRSRLLHEGRWVGELTHVRRDGQKVVVASQWVVHQDGEGRPAAILEVNNDVTAQKQAEEELRQSEEEYRRSFEQQAREQARELERRVEERTRELQQANAALKTSNEALRESEERFRSMIEGVKDYAIFRLDPQGRVLTWNAGAERIKGYRAEEIIGQHFSCFYSPEDRERGVPERGLREAVEKGRFEAEGWRVRKDGSRFWANVLITPLFDGDGRLQGYTKVTRDITARKELEEQLQRHAEQLEQRTRELQEANAALEAFGYSVSHDLRTPLRNMQSLANALEEDYADHLDAGGRDFCRRIIAAARKMDTLINDLLAYSRLSRSDLPLARVDLNGVLAEVQAALAEVIRDGAAQVTVEGPLPVVFGHRPTLVQVVTNLVSNALKFVAPGVRPRVRVHAEQRGEFVRLWVEDNGIGIAPNHQQRIFKVFERLHGEESYPGTGIGLAIVRKGVERTGGRAGVESEPGQGSRFWVDLPHWRGQT
jgi:PAS domain S-box-containing protein